eukprot:g33681.t1
MAVVLEAACTSTSCGAWGFDVVCDCRGFQLSKNLDPRPAVAAMEMLKHAYRGRLRHAFLVGAPSAFNALWRMVKGLLPKRTQDCFPLGWQCINPPDTVFVHFATTFCFLVR